jgi:ectoine hydroxylase-related dioxygenase (phytanoyl-CoA dioxygenase family)
MNRFIRSTHLRECFEQHGIVIVKGLLSKAEIAEQRRAVHRLIEIRLESKGKIPIGDIDADLGQLADAIDIIRAVKDSPFFFGVLSHPKLQDAAKECLGCETLIAVHDIAQFRIDPPNDDGRNFDWHQDFPYNVTSLDAITVWYPLTSVTEDMGPLIVWPNSHRKIADVAIEREGHGPGRKHAAIRFDVDRESAEREATTLCPIDEGDVVLFHSLLLHRSGANRSPRARWTVNPRFSNAADPAFAGRGWLAVRDKTQDLFERLYPGYVR